MRHLPGLALCLSLVLLAPPAAAATRPPPTPVDITVHDEDVLRRGNLRNFFGFNLNHYRFERDLLRADGTVEAGPVAALEALAGAFLRYPGGLVSNHFRWDAALGPARLRTAQKSVRHASPAPVRFGVDEYLGLLQSTGMRLWYVLNLHGWSSEEMHAEVDSETIARSNAALAKHVHENYRSSGTVYYQLGNELDRAEYQWPVEKYVARARDTMDAIRAVDPDARFVAFLRDFDWTYKGARDPRKGQVSTYEDLIEGVLNGLPDVTDFSLHFYYDDPGLDKNYKEVGTRLKQIRNAIDVARDVRKGDTPDVWITEHARGVNLKQGKGSQRAHLTSNLSAAVSTADFLIGITQIPEIKGAFWHGINAGPWQLFDASIRHKDLRPRPVYWGYRVLTSVLFDETLRTEVGAQPGSQYRGGYDVSAAAFRNPDSGSLGLWIANRRDQPVDVNVRYAPFARRDVTAYHYQMHAETGADAESEKLEPTVELAPAAETLSFGGNGVVTLRLQPFSVSAVEVRPGS